MGHPIGSKTLTSFFQRRRRKLHYGDKNENVSDVFSTKRSSDTKEISFAIKKKTEPKYYYYEFKLLCVISTKSRIIHTENIENRNQRSKIRKARGASNTPLRALRGTVADQLEQKCC